MGISQKSRCSTVNNKCSRTRSEGIGSQFHFKMFVKGLKEKARVCSFNFLLKEIICMFIRIKTCIWKVKLNVKITSYFRKCFLTEKSFCFQRSEKIFWVGTSRVGSVGWRQTNKFLSPALLTFAKIVEFLKSSRFKLGLNVFSHFSDRRYA